MTVDMVDPATSARTGFWILPGFLDRAQQDSFVEHARQLGRAAPFMHPRMRNGTPLSVKVSSFGERGWWADEQGYRYVERHPDLRPFAPIPSVIMDATAGALTAASLADASWSPSDWAIPSVDDFIRDSHGIDTCLVNLYQPGAQLGWHVDQTERDRVSPIVTFSLGASCVFWIELGPEGEAVRYRHTLRSGDAVVMAGPARLARHQVTNVHADEPDLFSQVYNPIAKSAPGVRLSFSVRRTGW